MTVSFAYSLHHAPADPEAIKSIIEALRRHAIALGFQRVGSVVFLQGNLEILSDNFGLRFVDLPIEPIIPEIACYFTGWENEPFEIGLCRYPLHAEVGGLSIPWGTPDWHWTGATRTCDLETFRKLFHFAAEIGIEVSMSVANKTTVFSPDTAGTVKVTVESDEL